ncbi:DUF5801 repeats-in-toxin domain-containing protein [Sedimentitalea sp. HM32M-2]|uniref:DUF5801 repeats-in-toxin domain-containing protein n=1 Tax=Sedimentitalea sp. HM32M-2 TaxID=3351566 RepID=UPI00362BB03E
MSEDALVISGPINIDETSGVQAGTDEIPVANLSTELSGGLYTYLDNTYLTGGEALGDPDNLSLLASAISTPDGFNNLSWTDAAGVTYSGTASTLKALDPDSGTYETVSLTTDPANDNILVGTTASGNIAFIAIIDSTSSTSSDVFLMNFLAMEQTNDMDPNDISPLIANISVTSSQVFDDFSDAPSGANDWLAFGDSAGGIQLLATSTPYEIDSDNAVDPDDQGDNSSVNSSTIGLGTNKQSVKVGDQLRLDLVTGTITGAALTATLTHDADAITFGQYVTGVNQFKFGLVQTGGNAGNRVDVNVDAFFVDTAAQGGTSDAEFFHNSVEDGTNETQVSFERVEVLNSSDVVVAFWDAVDGFDNSGDTAVNITIDGMTANVENVIEDYSIRVFSTTDMNRIEITNDSGGPGSLANKTFDIGAIEVGNIVGDTDPFQMDFVDDAPAQDAANAPLELFEDALSIGGLTLTDGRPDNDGETEVTSLSTDLNNVVNPGQDLPLSFGLKNDAAALAALDAIGLTSGGVAITHSVAIDVNPAGDDVLTAAAGGTTIYTVTVAEDGTATIDLVNAMDHPQGLPNQPDDDEIVVDFTGVLHAEDAEGDDATFTAQALVGSFEDDGPAMTAGAAAPSLEVDETDFSTDASASFAGVFNPDYGADGAAASDPVTYALSVTDASSGLTDTLTGQAVTLSEEGGDVVGRNGDGDEVLRISVSALGVVTLDQSRSVVHPDDTDPDDVIAMAAGKVALTGTAEDGDGDTDDLAVDISTSFSFRDDGPAISPAIADGTVDFTDGDTASDTGFLDYGNDGAGSFTFVGYTEQLPDDTVLGAFSETLSAGDTVITYSTAGNGDLFQITLDGSEPGGYTFEVLQDAPVVLTDLGISSVDAGGPSETEVVPAPSGTIVTFDGFLSNNFNGDPLVEYAAGNQPPPPLPDGGADDDVNISTPGIGLKDNQMDPGEQLKISFSQDISGIQLLFEGATGPANTFDIRFVAYDDGIQVAGVAYLDEPLPKGNSDLLVDFLTGEAFDVETDPLAAGEDFDDVFVFINFDGPKTGVRIKEVSLYEQVAIPDFSIDYTVRATDDDMDYVEDSFTVNIDSDSDGFIMV